MCSSEYVHHTSIDKPMCETTSDYEINQFVLVTLGVTNFFNSKFPLAYDTCLRPQSRSVSVCSCAFVCIMIRDHVLVVDRAQMDQVMPMITAAKKRPPLRVLVLTSPPWGVFQHDVHDVPIDDHKIKVHAHTTRLFPSNYASNF